MRKRDSRFDMFDTSFFPFLASYLLFQEDVVGVDGGQYAIPHGLILEGNFKGSPQVAGVLAPLLEWTTDAGGGYFQGVGIAQPSICIYMLL